MDPEFLKCNGQQAVGFTVIKAIYSGFDGAAEAIKVDGLPCNLLRKSIPPRMDKDNPSGMGMILPEILVPKLKLHSRNQDLPGPMSPVGQFYLQNDFSERRIPRNQMDVRAIAFRHFCLPDRLETPHAGLSKTGAQPVPGIRFISRCDVLPA